MRKGAELVLLHWTTGVYLKDIFVFAVVVIYTCEATQLVKQPLKYNFLHEVVSPWNFSAAPPPHKK